MPFFVALVFLFAFTLSASNTNTTLTTTNGPTVVYRNNRSINEHIVRLYFLLSKHFPLCLFQFPPLSLHREVGQQKRVLMSGPSWRSVPKSKSSGAILQELPSPSWGSGTITGVYLCISPPSSTLHSIRLTGSTRETSPPFCVCAQAQGAASWTSCRRRWRGEPASRSSRSGGRQSGRQPWDSTPNPANSWTWTSSNTRVRMKEG